MFYRLGSFAYRRRWMVLAFWVALIAVCAYFAPGLSERLQGGGFSGAGTEAERVQETMVEEFGVSPANLNIVFEGDGSPPADSEEFQREVQEALEGLDGLGSVSFVRAYADTQDPRFISEDGEKSYAVVGFDASANETQDLVGEEIRDRVSSEELEVHVTGPPAVYLDIQEASNEDIRQAETYAFPLALVILVAAFGTLVAAGVPVLMGGAGVVASLGALYLISGFYDMSTFVLTISTMLALGLGIDYALLAVSRFREEMESYPVSEAVPRTVATAGRAVFFSGTAVLIGLSGLLFFPYTFIRSIGTGGVVVVFVSVAAALTLLPASLGIIGHRVNALPVRRRSVLPGANFWSRGAEVVMRRPVVVLFAVGAVLAAMLYPVEHMRLGLPEASVLPTEYESRVGSDILKEDFNYASLTPMQIPAELPAEPTSAAGLADTRELGQRVARTGGVEEVESLYTTAAAATREYVERVTEARAEARAEAERQKEQAVQQRLDQLREQFGGTLPPGAEERVRQEAESQAEAELAERIPELPEGISADGEVTPEEVAAFLDTPEARDGRELQSAIDSYTAGDQTLLRATTAADPYSGAARETVGGVREVEPPEGVSFQVGGLTAGQRDFITTVYGLAPYVVAFVLGVTYLVLAFTFRSVLLPLKAVFVNVLSLTASFGAIVWVFQDGNLSGLLGFTPLEFVPATTPVLMFCTVFGVSMDYEVFLLSRIREAYENGDSNTASVAKGLASTAGIITSAAAIIVVVTGAFAFTGITTTKAIGLGLAVAVFVDATIIRILLVPAAMRILGDWNWWPGGRKKTFASSLESGPEESGREPSPADSS